MDERTRRTEDIEADVIETNRRLYQVGIGGSERIPMICKECKVSRQLANDILRDHSAKSAQIVHEQDGFIKELDTATKTFLKLPERILALRPKGPF
jgi:hypothetical protein